MNMVRRNSEIKPFYSNFLDDFLNTGLSAFEDRRGVPALNVKEDVGVGIESSGDEKRGYPSGL